MAFGDVVNLQGLRQIDLTGWIVIGGAVSIRILPVHKYRIGMPVV
jgi:hypothetical protein